MDAETLVQVKQMISESETRTNAAIASAKASYVKADSRLHVFIREHPQAAFNCGVFCSLIVGAVAEHFLKL